MLNNSGNPDRLPRYCIACKGRIKPNVRNDGKSGGYRVSGGMCEACARRERKKVELLAIIKREVKA